MRNRISGDAVYFGGCINLIDTINTPKFLGGDLAGCGFFVRGQRCKRKHAASPDSQYTADDSLLAHAESHQAVRVLVSLEKFHHGDVVI